MKPMYPANVDATVDRVDRFQSLQAGQYWRALKDIVEQGIDAGTVLLIESIRWVDDAPHTVILRPHPTNIGKAYECTRKDKGGSKWTGYVAYKEHRFRLSDFLGAFEFEPDHQQVRSTELREAQSRVAGLQAELIESQSNPRLLANVVESELRAAAENESAKAKSATKKTASGKRASAAASAAAPAESPQPVGGALVVFDQAAASLATGTVAAAMGAGITSEGIAAMKLAAGREHQVATIKATWIQGKTTEIAKAIMAMTPFYEEQAAAALAQTEDVRTYVANLLLGIESLDLYVGNNVEVETIREGAAAARSVPLTFVQKKLAMDEELAVWADVEKTFDFSDEKLFLDAVRDNDGLIEQIFPTERCVLVMAVSRRYINYGDNLLNMLRNDENRKVFLLIRNGMNIHRVYSSVESHLKTDRLFPTKDDQERVFRGIDGESIKFEDVAYTDKLSDHERFALHYKRFLLLACGLDHRLKLFGDFYEGPASLAFVSMAFQREHCRFLYDDDRRRMLAGSGRPPVAAWLAEKNAFLRSGSRVACHWKDLMTPDSAPGACKVIKGDRWDGGYRRGFNTNYNPADRFGVAIAYKDGASACVDVEVSGDSYNAAGVRTFSCKVNLSKVRVGEWDTSDLPFICLDTVEPDELRWYIHHRDSRKDHLSYILLFKRALQHVEAERAEEVDTRRRLSQALLEGNVASPAERPGIISQAITAWRAANRGKALPAFVDASPPTGWKSLLDQMYMLAGEGRRQIQEVEAFLKMHGLEPLRLVLSGSAKFVVYAAPKPEECDNRMEPHAWVHRIALERGKQTYSERSRRWVLLPAAAASETVIHEWASAAEWSGRNSIFPSFERKTELFGCVNAFRSLLDPLLRAVTEDEAAKYVEAWAKMRKAIMIGAKYVENPSLAIPFGVAYYPRSNLFELLCLGARQAHPLLARLIPNDAARARLRDEYVSVYEKKQSARTRFDTEMTGDDSEWQLLVCEVQPSVRPSGIFVHESMAIGARTMGERDVSPLLSDWYDAWFKANKNYAVVWLADDVADDARRRALDAVLGIEMPADYEPVRLREIMFLDSTPAEKYGHWVDLCPGAKAPGYETGGTIFSSNDTELAALIKSVIPDGPASYSCSNDVYLTRAAAREAVMRRATKLRDDVVAIPAADLAGAPASPPGFERWYFVSADAPGKAS